MIFNIFIKDPDGVYEGLRDAIQEQVNSIEGLSNTERDLIIEERWGSFTEKCSKWIESNECLTVQIDLGANTAVVLPRK